MFFKLMELEKRVDSVEKKFGISSDVQSQVGMESMSWPIPYRIDQLEQKISLLLKRCTGVEEIMNNLIKPTANMDPMKYIITRIEQKLIFIEQRGVGSEETDFKIEIPILDIEEKEIDQAVGMIVINITRSRNLDLNITEVGIRVSDFFKFTTVHDIVKRVYPDITFTQVK